MYLKEIFLLSYRSWKVLRFKFEKKNRKSFSDKLTSCNLKIIFMSPIRVKSLFTFKDKLANTLLSGLVYKYKYGACNATYFGKTKHHSKI